DTAAIQTNVVRISAPPTWEGKRQVYIPIFRRPGSNTIEVVQGVRKRLPEFLSRLPVKAKPKVPELKIKPEPQPKTPIVRVSRGDVERPIVRPVPGAASEIKRGPAQAEANDSGLVLNVVADQSVFVRDAVSSLIQEGLIGAAL